LDTMDLLKRTHSLGAVSVLAHPLRRGAWRCFNEAWLEFLSGVEVWNSRHGDITRDDSTRAFASATSALPRFYSLDFHSGRDLHQFGMRLRLNGRPSCDAVFDAIRLGRLVPDETRPRGLLRQQFVRAHRAGSRWTRRGPSEENRHRRRTM
jgi:hypothetical protein